MKKFSPDADLRNADWTRQSWDLDELRSAAELREYLDRRGMTVKHFKSLPVYKLNLKTIPWLKDL